MSAGILIVWTDVPVEIEADFNAWYNHEHLPELAALRGIDTAVFARRNAEVTRASSTGDDRAGDRYVDGLLAIEAGSETGVAAAIALLSAQNLARMGGNAHLVAAPCALRLMYTLEAPPTTVAGGGDKAA